MTRRILCATVMVAALISFLGRQVAAQEGLSLPAISVHVQAPASAPVMAMPFNPASTNKPPKYCKPCLFYSGDFDPNYDANGLFNGDVSSLGIEAWVYAAFKVPKGHIWRVTGLFINTLSNASAVDPTVTWDVRKGVTTGSGGTDVATGTGKQTWAPTGRSGFALTEYTDKTPVKPSVKLKAGTYFMNVLTSCTTDSCNGDLFYESDEEHRPGLHHYGPPAPWDDSYFNAPGFGADWQPTWGPGGGNAFSVGVLGTCETVGGKKCAF